MNIDEFLGIGIVGALLSVAFELIKGKYPSSPNKSKGLIILLSLIVGGLYVWVRETPYFPTVLGVLGGASAVYSLFFNKK